MEIWKNKLTYMERVGQKKEFCLPNLGKFLTKVVFTITIKSEMYEKGQYTQ